MPEAPDDGKLSAGQAFEAVGRVAARTIGAEPLVERFVSGPDEHDTNPILLGLIDFFMPTLKNVVRTDKLIETRGALPIATAVDLFSNVVMFGSATSGGNFLLQRIAINAVINGGFEVLKHLAVRPNVAEKK